MGMFKDLKKLSDQGKEVQKAQGKKTGMLGMLQDLPDTLHQATEAVDDAMALQADMAKQQALLTTGTAGTATIKSFTDTGVIVNFNPQIVFDISVEVPGKPAYDAKVSAGVPAMQAPLVQPGCKVGVKVDPTDPNSIAIDWTRPQG
ncbi:MAG: hypothetical protein EXQ79_01015 [Acidimicrobiia bacterium]|nr:hypothetical protein [Acidimicrobiia bacterium]